MRHIALLIPTIDRIGGAERQVLVLARHLARRDWRVSVVALAGTGGAAAGELAAQNIAYVSLEMRKGLADPRGWLRFHRWLTRERPDVVHAHLPHAAWLARWSRLFAPGHAQIDTIHTTATGALGRRLGYRLSDGLPAAVTAVSASVAEAYTGAKMVTPGHLHVIPNGIDTEAWSPDPEARETVRRELGLNGEFVWLAAGRMDAVKDYPTLLRAFARTPAAARLLIAGAGPLKQALRQFARDLGIAERVRFLGFQADLLGWIRAADGFVQASLWEGLPMAILEASACGLPVVATGVPGTREAVRDGQTGLLAAAQSAAALADAMLRVARAPESVRYAMGAAGRRFVAEHYGIDSVMDRWESLYGTLLARRTAPLTLAASRPA